MKTALFITALSLSLCNSAGSQTNKNVLPIDLWQEKLNLYLSAEWKLAFSSRNPEIQTLEYLLPGESLENCTDMVTTIVFSDANIKSIDQFLKRLSEEAPKGCELTPTMSSPRKYFDDAYPAAFQIVECKRAKRSQLGEAYVYKIVQGSHGFFQIQRAWRFPADSRAHGFPISREAFESGARIVAAARLCDIKHPTAPCREYATERRE